MNCNVKEAGIGGTSTCPHCHVEGALINPYHFSGCSSLKFSQGGRDRAAEVTVISREITRVRRVSDVHELDQNAGNVASPCTNTKEVVVAVIPPAIEARQPMTVIDTNSETPVQPKVHAVVTAKKLKVSSPTSDTFLSWSCLYCGKQDCSYETVTPSSVKDGDSFFPEWDTKEPPERDESDKYYSVQQIPERAITLLVREVLTSPSFFAWNKFMGAVEDTRIMVWVEAKLSHSRYQVQQMWPKLRRAIKETLRWRRQRCVLRVKETFISKFVVSGNGTNGRG